jgi:purine-binding chemotaxis protein CheW
MAEATVVQAGGSATACLAGKYLTFKLANEEYGLEILKVREIIGLLPITSLPRTPVFVRGVINLRGKVIPVIDLRQKFDLDATDDTAQTCIIVVDVSGHFGSVQIGILVDSVSEVLDIRGEEIEEPPAFGSSVDTAFILGMAKVKGSVKILLNIEKVLSQAELEHVAAAG